MNLHEYQSKQLFAAHGLPVVPGDVATSGVEAVKVAKKLGGKLWVVKAQVHAGGRGKAGGVKIAKNFAEVKAHAESLLGTRLVTIQTDADGQPIDKVFIESGASIANEFYMSMVVDRTTRRISVIASTEGGVDIEAVAEQTPEKMFRQDLSPYGGASSWQARAMAFQLGLTGSAVREFTDLFLKLADMFQKLDCSLLEINPLVLTSDGELKCLDAKINIDDNALYRQPEIVKMRDPAQEDQQERDAAAFDLNYVALEGNIGCMVNGAGLAMGTMDLVKSAGGYPANFLDVGGGASQKTVAEAFKIILSDPKVRAVLINIFGGIVSCVVIAEGIVAAIKEVGVTVPVVVRFEGNNAAKGREYLSQSDMNVIPTISLQDAAEKSVKAAEGASI